MKKLSIEIGVSSFVTSHYIAIYIRGKETKHLQM